MPIPKDDSDDNAIAYGFAPWAAGRWAGRQRTSASGPKKGKKVTPLKVYAVTGEPMDKEVDYAGLRKDKPTVYVFVSAKDFDRPMFRYLKKLDRDVSDRRIGRGRMAEQQYGQNQKSICRRFRSISRGRAHGVRQGRRTERLGDQSRCAPDRCGRPQRQVVKSFGYLSLNETDAPEVVRTLKKAIKK